MQIMPNLIASLVICCYCCWVAGSSFLCYCFSLFPFAALLLTQFYTLNTHTRGHFSNFISHATVDFLFAPSLSHAIPSSSSSENTTDDDFGVVVAGGLF